MTVPVKIVGLIDARNGLRDAIVRLRGGHGATQDACDQALAALDIAIGGVTVGRATDACVPVDALRALLKDMEHARDTYARWGWRIPEIQVSMDAIAALCDAAEQP